MRVLGLIVAALLSGLFIYVGEQSFKVGNTQLPPIVKFMNPYYGFWSNADPINPIARSVHSIPQLEANAEVYFDDNLVPHIYAENMEDMFRLQGYVHASQRLWQIDMISRAAGGRLAEVVGESAIEHDIYQRKIGMLYAAENALEGVRKYDKTMSYVNAYCEGANAYIENLPRKKYPLEYKLMNFKPRKWEPLDVLLLFKQMSYDLCFKHADVESTYTRAYMGSESYDSLFVIKDYAAPIIPSQDTWRPRNIDTLSQERILMPQKFPAFHKQDDIHPNNGSNNWAVSGLKTASGNPMLASDPHLSMSLPSIWYENHLSCNEMNAYGVSLPGMPAILIGFNDHIAWGETNVGHDVADWSALKWKGDDFSTYILDSIEHKTDLRIERIAVKGADTLNINLFLTKAGIVAHTEDPDDARYGLAFHWISHDASSTDELSTFPNLNKARNLIEYQEAISTFATPAQNFAFASTEGDIAITVQGKYPVKDINESNFIQVVTEADQINRNYIPMEQIPRQVNPDRQYIASANQVSTAEDYPYYYNSSRFEHFRNRHLNAVLDSATHITIEDFEKMQLSDYSKEAEYALSVLLPILEELPLKQEHQAMLNSLASWNNDFNRNAEEPVLYSYFISEIMSHAWDEWEDPDLIEILRYPSIYNTLQLIEQGGKFSYMLNRADGSSYGSVKELVKESFEVAASKFAKAKSSNSNIKWSDYKATVIGHMAGIKAFSTDTLHTGGHHSALNAQKGNHGPSWRMIVSMSNPVTAYGVYPGGQSGNPGSRFYDNMVEEWVEGRYHKIDIPKEPGQLKNKMKKWVFQ